MLGERSEIPLIVVVFGVAGIGKTTIAERLAVELDARFADADDYHDPRNVARMSAGIPLEDEDRWEWLQRIRAVLDASAERVEPIVLACSALKESYRNVLRINATRVLFIELVLDRSVLERRIAARRDHFMPATMLDSQLSSFEPLSDAERASGSFSVSAEPPVDVIVAEILEHTGRRLLNVTN